MVATIQLSPYIYVQGRIIRTLSNGHVAIHDGGKEYVGLPLRRSLRAAVAVTPVEANSIG
jgi:hypothetical protein